MSRSCRSILGRLRTSGYAHIERRRMVQWDRLEMLAVSRQTRRPPSHMSDRNTPRNRQKRSDTLETIRVCGCLYEILKKISRGDRRRYQVRQHRPHGQMRQLLIFPQSETSRQHLRVLRRLSQSNPNFPAIIDMEHRDGEIRVVTTWVPGQDLQAHLRPIKRGAASWDAPFRVIKLYRGLAHGLRQMHNHPGVYHGDISPKNLVLARGPERLVMIDFGSAWTVERTTTRMEGDGLSRAYAAPEQLRKDPAVDFRADQFSASVVAYEMFTGACPYAERGGCAGLPENRSRYEPLYRPPSSQCPVRDQIPQRVWRLIDEVMGRALRLDPSDRFQEPSDWLEGLEDIHCEIRRKTRFSRLDSAALGVVRWFGGRMND